MLPRLPQMGPHAVQEAALRGMGVRDLGDWGFGELGGLGDLGARGLGIWGAGGLEGWEPEKLRD